MVVLVALTVTGPPSSADAEDAFSATREDSQVLVRGDHFRIVIDAGRGGEISDLRLFDGMDSNRILGGDGQTCPDVTLGHDGHSYRLSRDPSARVERFEFTPEVARVRISGTPKSATGESSPWRITLDYEIYPQGGVFVEIRYSLPQGETVLDGAWLSLVVDATVAGAPKYRQSDKPRVGKSFPSARIALGVDPSKSFTNEIAAVVENRAAMAGTTGYEVQRGRFRWILADGETTLPKGFSYVNRFSMALGCSATGKPRTNLLGQRVYHWINYLDRKATDQWYPTNRQIDQMAANGATMLILHQDWMRQSGSNGKPHADYAVVRHAESMRRAIDHAHEKNLRVGLYCRGIERYHLPCDVFRQYCRRDADGLYVDWHGPHAVAFHEKTWPEDRAVGDRHFSADGSVLPAREYFLFTKQLRDVVGPGGFLIGHMGIGNAGIMPNLLFDAYLPGEAASDRAMFSDRDGATFAGMLGGGLCMPWPMDSPGFTSPQGIARMAAWGFYPHIGLGLKRSADGVVFPLDPDHPANAYALRYWNVLSTIDVESSRVFNLPSQRPAAAVFSHPRFEGVVYRQSKPGRRIFLVVAANLGDETAESEIRLESEVLGLSGNYRVLRVDSRDGTPAPRGTARDTLLTGEVPGWGIVGFLLSPEN